MLILLYPLLKKYVKGYIVFVGMYVTGRRKQYFKVIYVMY